VEVTEIGLILDIHERTSRPGGGRKLARLHAIEPGYEQNGMPGQILLGGYPVSKYRDLLGSRPRNQIQPPSEAFAAPRDANTQGLRIQHDRQHKTLQ
jgi:hypothetical protein